jgi:hypothetical protein
LLIFNPALWITKYSATVISGNGSCFKTRSFACLTTELILSEGRHHEYFTYEEIEKIFLEHPLLDLVGGDMDLSISASLIEYLVDLDLPNVRLSPHIVLKRGDLIWTSLSMFLRRNEKAV